MQLWYGPPGWDTPLSLKHSPPASDRPAAPGENTTPASVGSFKGGKLK